MKLHSILVALLCVITLFSNSQTVFLAETFDGQTIPFTWTEDNNHVTSKWLSGTHTSASSSSWNIPPNGNFIYSNDDACNCDKSNDRLISPSLSLIGASNAHLKMNYFFNGASYNGFTESAKVEISIDGGAYIDFATLSGAADWQTNTFDLSAYLGSDVTLALSYSDNGGWLFGIALNEVMVYEAPSTDLALINITTAMFNDIGDSIQVSGLVSNLGLSAANDYELTYSLNGQTKAQTFNSSTLTSFGQQNFAFTTKELLDTGSSSNLKVWVSKVNGISDNVPENDTLTMTLQVVTEHDDQLPIVELFSAATCGACVTNDEYITEILVNEKANIEGGNLSAIYYHVDSNAQELGYTTALKKRYDDYSFSDFPGFVVNGLKKKKTINFNRASLNNTPSFSTVKMNLNYSFSGSNLTVNTELISLVNQPNQAIKLFVVVSEREVTIPNSGSSEIKYLARSILPNNNGQSIGMLTLNDTVNNTFSENINVGNPVSVGSGDYFVGEGNISVVAFLQDTSTLEIIQSAVINWPVSIEEEIIENNSFMVYPNPFNEFITIVNLNESKEFSLSLFDLSGRLVHNEKVNSTTKILNFGTEIKQGMYTLKIQSKGNVFTKKILKIQAH